MYNEFKTSAHVNGLQAYIYAPIDRFANSARYDYKNLEKDIEAGITQYYRDIYKSMTFM